jgi:uncharacterized protein (TIGR02145 family)
MKQLLLFSFLIFFSILGCKKEDIAIIPFLSTSPLNNITVTSAVCGGYVTSDGGAAITASGVCWSTSEKPSISNSKTVDGDGSSPFKSSLRGLNANTKYYVRAYATNIEGTSYGDEKAFTTYKTNAISDYEGNLYNIVAIGNQIWTVENLKSTKFNDGTEIPLNTDNKTFASLPAAICSWYNNDAENNKSTYGALYNWYSVNSGKLCPAGWHVPSRAEWETLITYAGNGGMLKEPGTLNWNNPNLGATDKFGFTALPGGIFSDRFCDMKDDGQWWSSTEYTDLGFNDGWSFILFYNNDKHAFNHDYKTWSKSIRCVKN